jgi:hypothetical protein
LRKCVWTSALKAALPLLLPCMDDSTNECVCIQLGMYLGTEGCPAVAAAYECMVLQAMYVCTLMLKAVYHRCRCMYMRATTGLFNASLCHMYVHWR